MLGKFKILLNCHNTRQRRRRPSYDKVDDDDDNVDAYAVVIVSTFRRRNNDVMDDVMDCDINVEIANVAFKSMTT